MDIKKLAKQIHNNNVRKGFWDKERNEGEVLFLIITELAEICEAQRKDKNADIEGFEADMKRQSKFKYSPKHKLQIKKDSFEKHIKDSVGDELADTFIRLCDYCVGFKVAIDQKNIDLFVSFKNTQLDNLAEQLLEISNHIYIISKISNKSICVSEIFTALIWLSNQLGINLEKHIKYKMWYNSTRPKMHGKKY